MTLAELEQTGEMVHNSEYVSYLQGVAIDDLHALAAMAVEKVLKLDAPFEYIGGSGIVKTGKSIHKADMETLYGGLSSPSGQEFHLDCLNALQSELLARFYSGQLGEDLNDEEKKTVLNAGYIIDFALSETGRVTKVLIPGTPGSKELLARLIYTPFGSITIRSMLLMHGGHGGACGNTLWHGSIFPKGATKDVDEDRLGYLRLLPTYHEEFSEYRVKWLSGTKREPHNWLKNFGHVEKKMSSRYAEKLYKNSKYSRNVRVGCSRWLLGPNEEPLKLKTEGASTPAMSKKKRKTVMAVDGSYPPVAAPVAVDPSLDGAAAEIAPPPAAAPVAAPPSLPTAVEIAPPLAAAAPTAAIGAAGGAVPLDHGEFMEALLRNENFVNYMKNRSGKNNNSEE